MCHRDDDFSLACPSSRYRMALGTSLSGYVLSMTGVTFPASMSSLRMIMSSWFSGRDERAQLLAHERGQHERADLTIGAPEPPSIRLASGDDEGPLGGEGAPEASTTTEFPPMSRIRS